ncbi:AraC family transcriptional regulator [Alteromonas gilva]|uniref:AraC family transcriptional regulator n=1 Tax=Alteromonas gilva TaxID=2987522 RepID=A0ABT5L1P8_9ALTE|nr:AraC family transcriptional regulator [Alteromonas gilva]MDC8829792.1 AraC family transcriptional regulator [Alteromonas gilva]
MTKAYDSQPRFPQNQDPFGVFIEQLKPLNSLYCFSTLSAPWGLELPAMPGRLMMHIVTNGHCVITHNDEQVPLAEGSLVLIPHGKGHCIKSGINASTIPFFDSGVRHLSPNLEVLDIPGPGDTTKLICGVVSFDPLIGQYLLEQLPYILYLQPDEYSDAAWLTSTLDLIKREAQNLVPGSETIITRLAEILMIQLIRHWLDHSPLAKEGWFAAMRDERIGATLRAIHQQPEKRWTVERLASVACMSRSAFAARFTELVGKSAKSYLTEWRLTLAHYQLRNRKVPLIELALSCGYESEAAFSRAFKRVIGFSPSSTVSEENHSK